MSLPTFGQGQSAVDDTRNYRDAMRAKHEVFKRVGSVLERANKSGRIYYRAICKADEVKPNAFQSIRFPDITLASSSEKNDPLAELREMFGSSQEVVISEDKPNIVRVKISDAPETVLRTRISSVTFSREDQFDPDAAISAVFAAKEVQGAEERLGTWPILRVANSLSAEPSPGDPHLPVSLKKLTVDQMLDAIAATFGLMVVYGACTEPKLFDVEFYSVRTPS
jgi:hypothetical protein